MDSLWPMFSDVAYSVILFFTFALIVQFLELSQVFDDLTRRQAQNSLQDALQSQAFFQKMIDENTLTVRIQGSLQRFSFAADIVFVAGEASLQQRGLEVLTQFAQFISERAPSQINIEVEGHTDRLPVTSGRYRDNWELSSERALTVVRLFQSLSLNESSGVHLDPARISAIGYGEYRPVENDVIASRKNRRVEIRLDYSPLSSPTVTSD